LRTWATVREVVEKIRTDPFRVPLATAANSELTAHEITSPVYEGTVNTLSNGFVDEKILVAMSPLLTRYLLALEDPQVETVQIQKKCRTAKELQNKFDIIMKTVVAILKALLIE
jgi:uncharacterized circularly permuted ATP-grasp superfamily protein